jgi:myo-inositol-1(or 4)-monophosphatase
MTHDETLFKELSIFAGRLADAAGVETLPRFRAGAEVHNKAGPLFDPVTEADREAERAMRRMINAVYPRHGVIGEEFGKENPDAEFRWVLDPVDGTRAFICGVASWATLIAVERDKTPIASVIDQPFTGERWAAAGDAARYRRGGTERVCRTSGVVELSRARLSTTDPRRDGYMTGDEVAAFTAVASKARVARFSLDAYAYGLLAIGEIDLVIESSLNHHDYAALVPVVEAAGGVITGWRGEPVAQSERGRIIAAATPQLHRAALDILKST